MSDLITTEIAELEEIRAELDKAIEPKRRKRFKKLIAAALGSIPWVGGLLAGVATLRDEERRERVSDLQRQWLEEHTTKLIRLAETLAKIAERLDEFGEDVQARIESEEYLGIVKSAFRAWDRADTDEKRELLRKLIANAGATTIAPDDLVRLFIEWIDKYHEAHFAVIRAIYKSPGSTRGAIWEDIHGQDVREDSAEADLYKLLIRDLSTGSVLRQRRETDAAGRFLRKATRTRRTSQFVESAFEDTKPYVLTELGTQFVHYVMDEVVPRIGEAGAGSTAGNGVS